MKRSKQHAEHYLWGQNCDGWKLVNQDSLCVIQERMPPQTAEIKHYHEKSRQFFYVLTGILTITVHEEVHQLEKGEGLDIPPLAIHQVMNKSEEDVEFLVISQPTTTGDRIPV